MPQASSYGLPKRCGAYWRGDRLALARAPYPHPALADRRGGGYHSLELPLRHTRALAAAAFAAGCTVVAKPASATPVPALALAALGLEAGVRPGAFNNIFGAVEAIDAELTANPTVRMLSFTGSTETDKRLFAACAGTVKKLALELGGNAPFIVFEDADLDAAVKAGTCRQVPQMWPELCSCQPHPGTDGHLRGLHRTPSGHAQVRSRLGRGGKDWPTHQSGYRG